MFKFFRKIRYNLIEKEKTGKYFKYAIGEIALVVIGILIALQINNWNEHRKQNNLETSYLISLQEEFEANLVKLHAVQARNTSNLEYAKQLANHTGPDTPTLSELELSNLITGTLINEIQYRPGTGILNEIISSGKLSIISNPELKKALASLDGLMLRVRFQENEEHGDSRNKLFDVIAQENISFRKAIFESFGEINGVKNSKFLDSNLYILQSKHFDNFLTGFIHTGSFLQDNYYTQLEEQIEAIIAIIEEQLKDN